MNNLIRKKVILCLLDSDPKSADEVASEIGESLATVADQLTALVSEIICEEVKPDEVSQYVVRKDVETFAQLVEEFVSNPEVRVRDIKQFFTSNHYHTRIDYALVDYGLSRFDLDSVFQTDEEKETLRRILLVSPSALSFTLNGDSTFFRGLRSGANKLDSLDPTRERNIQFIFSQFQTLLLEKLITDMKVPPFSFLHTVLQLNAAKISIEVNLAAPHAKYIQAIGESHCTLSRMGEVLGVEELGLAVSPMDLSNDGAALMQLGEFQAALEHFDGAFEAFQDPSHKALVLNNKGVVFLRLKQYQKAIECFEEGITFDSGSEIPLLRQNKQTAEEYLARATDADNLTEPAQIRFVQRYPIPFEETLFYEFKEIKGGNPVRSITNDSDEYTVAFLNREGGRIFWGVRDSDRITIGVTLNESKRNETRTKVSEKLGAIRPPISVEDWQLAFHNVYDSQGGIVDDLWIIELAVPSPQSRAVFYTGSGELFVKTEGGKKKLQGPEATEFIIRHLQNDTETD